MGHPREGRDAVRVFADTPSRLRKFAFGWRTPSGLPPGRNLPPDSIENVPNRLDDGAVLARLGGEHWMTREMIDNRHEQLAAWPTRGSRIGASAS